MVLVGDVWLYNLSEETEVTNLNPEILDSYQKRVYDTLGTEFSPGTQEDDCSQATEENIRHIGYIESYQ